MTPTPEPTDTDPLAFALATAVLIGASMIGGFALSELLRRKCCEEKEQER